MNKFFATICCFLCLLSCTKTSPEFVVTENPFEVMPSRFKQNVLIEHFSDELQTLTVENGDYIDFLKLKFNGRLFDANFHQNDFLATPYSTYISQSLGGALNIGQAAINRLADKNVHSNDSIVWLPNTKWESLIYEALKSEDAPLSISLETGIGQTGNGFANVYIAHKQAIPNNCRLVIYLLEDQINPVDQQGLTPNFKHQSVFKTTLTAWDGDPIDLSKEIEAGEIVKRSYENILLKDHNINRLKVMAFIYSNSSDFRKKQIINVQEVKFNGLHFWDI